MTTVQFGPYVGPSLSDSANMEVLGYSIVEADLVPPDKLIDVTTSAQRLSGTNEVTAVYSRGEMEACQTFLAHGFGSDDVCFRKQRMFESS
jgi:hypothetical protein